MKCDNCDKNAVKNFQLTWIVWDVDEDGNYSEDHSLLEGDSEDNRHYCEEHAEEFENGEL